MEHRDAVGALIHLYTACWAVFAGMILVRLSRGHGVGRWAFAFYAASMVLLYTASGLFHALLYLATGPNGAADPAVRERAINALGFFQKLDKSAIFLLIAGSNVPIMVYLLRGRLRRLALDAMLGAAVVGIAALWLLPKVPHPVTVGIYVLMGVAGVLPLQPYRRVIGWRGISWVLTFAGLYLTGAAIELAKWPTPVPGYLGPHELLHLFVSAGTVCHFAFLILYILPRRPSAGGHGNIRARSPRAAAVA